MVEEVGELELGNGLPEGKLRGPRDCEDDLGRVPFLDHLHIQRRRFS
jgi:hypothetical protein